MPMKDLDKTCGDCPSRELFPDIAALMRHLIEDYPEISKQVQQDGMSPMFGAVLALRTQKALLVESEEKVEALQQRLVPGVNCNESD